MPRFIDNRDLNFIHKLQREVVDEVVDTKVKLWKIDREKTEYDLYGDPITEGEVFWRLGVTVHCMISKEDQITIYDEYGLDKQQNIRFAFHRETLREINVYPEEGDVIEFYDAYFEIGSIIENQLWGGQTNVRNRISIICDTHMITREKLNFKEDDRIR